VNEVSDRSTPEAAVVPTFGPQEEERQCRVASSTWGFRWSRPPNWHAKGPVVVRRIRPIVRRIRPMVVPSGGRDPARGPTAQMDGVLCSSSSPLASISKASDPIPRRCGDSAFGDALPEAQPRAASADGVSTTRESLSPRSVNSDRSSARSQCSPSGGPIGGRCRRGSQQDDSGASVCGPPAEPKDRSARIAPAGCPGWRNDRA